MGKYHIFVVSTCLTILFRYLKALNHRNLPNWKCNSIQLFLVINYLNWLKMNLLQLYNSIISIAVVIFKYLLSMHGIAKLQSIP